MSDNDGPETEHDDNISGEEADDEETAEMRPLFPGDTGTTKEQWEELFPNDSNVKGT